MRIEYSVSLWNFYHYANQPSLERIVSRVRNHGYGIELWGCWSDEGDLYGEPGRRRIRPAVEGMRVSLHTAGAHTEELMAKHIDAAAFLGASVIVLHPADLAKPNDAGRPDIERTKRAVAQAADKGVTLALENGQFAFLREAMEGVDGLRFCFDVGHPYFPEHEGDYLGVLGERLVHLHIQDTLPEAEIPVSPGLNDHYIPGTGGIPRADWDALAATLRRIDFAGTAVFEVHPRDPMQTSFLARTFMDELMAR